MDDGTVVARRADAVRPRTTTAISLARLKVIAIVAPVTFLALVLFLLQGPAHVELHTFPGYVYLLLILSAVVSCFTFVVFGIIERLERQVLRQNEQLSIVNEISEAAETLDLDAFLDAALGTVLRVTRADVGLIWLVEEKTRELTLACYRGPSSGPALDRRHAAAEHEPFAKEAVRRGRPVVIERPLDHPIATEAVRGCGFRSAISLPLKAEGDVWGVLGVNTRYKRTFEPAEIDLLSSIAGGLALATRSARLREQVLDRAVLEERERLGRELHDSLGQMIGYVNTQTLAVKKLLASGCREEAERHLAAMEESSQRVSVDVREAILGLRASGGGLLPSLRMYLADYERIAGLRVLLETNGDATGLGLRRSIEFQLMRIVQEALSNVRKHAAATTATVRIATDEEVLSVEVADDGCGFDRQDPPSTAWPHFGLETMRERAEAIRGTFAIDTSPGAGTTVCVRVPLGRTTEAADARSAR